MTKKHYSLTLAIGLVLLSQVNLTLGVHADGLSPEARIKRQYSRIDIGLKNGALSQDQADSLKANVADIERDVAAKKASNNGSLKPEDLKTIESQLNENSNQIQAAKAGGSKNVNGSNTLGAKWAKGADGAQNANKLKKEMKSEEKREVRQEKQALEQKVENQQLDYEKQMVEKLGEQRPEIQKKKSELQEIRQESGAD
ncbi:MAG: hypothetical protein SFY67_11135 [Candidatus Melainabacteria bacterium]|nr:hypothetical protein [Candidatus Melainabacteria bacterium]